MGSDRQLYAVQSWGQATAPSFEAASIRRNRGGSLNTQIETSGSGQLTITNGSLKTLILQCLRRPEFSTGE